MERPIKVLIVEDEAWEARYLQVILRGLDYEFSPPVAKGADALASVSCDPPDVILMDIRLAGGMDGIETARQILERTAIPIIFMTGYALPNVRERAEALNPAAFLEKPVARVTINAVIADLFPHKQNKK